mmetsp:Transcript_12739/g.25566  ORF Transcript_12739/g.25566 Transcript_12739/m.25566 type:complete len:93 (-) Transcript_12739:277-555(-)
MNWRCMASYMALYAATSFPINTGTRPNRRNHMAAGMKVPTKLSSHEMGIHWRCSLCETKRAITTKNGTIHTAFYFGSAVPALDARMTPTINP